MIIRKLFLHRIDDFLKARISLAIFSHSTLTLVIEIDILTLLPLLSDVDWFTIELGFKFIVENVKSNDEPPKSLVSHFGVGALPYLASSVRQVVMSVLVLLLLPTTVPLSDNPLGRVMRRTISDQYFVDVLSFVW